MSNTKCQESASSRLMTTAKQVLMGVHQAFSLIREVQQQAMPTLAEKVSTARNILFLEVLQNKTDSDEVLL